MLVIAGTIRIDPDRQADAVPAAVEMMEATRAEPGCVSYTFSASLAEPGVIHVFEEWKDQTALDAHFASPHMARFQQAIGGFGIRGVDLHRYEVASKGPMGG